MKNGTHKYVCANCGSEKIEACKYAVDTHKCICGAVDPEYKAPVSVTISATVSQSNSGGWFTRTSYKATITVKASGTTIKTVQYSTDGGKTWKTGTSFTSSSAINSFLVRVMDEEGNVYTYSYPDYTCCSHIVLFALEVGVISHSDIC